MRTQNWKRYITGLLAALLAVSMPVQALGAAVPGSRAHVRIQEPSGPSSAVSGRNYTEAESSNDETAGSQADSSDSETAGSQADSSDSETAGSQADSSDSEAGSGTLPDEKEAA